MTEIIYKDHTFRNRDLVEGNVHMAASLASSALEANTMTFTVRSEDKSMAVFRRNDPLVYNRNGVQIGRFYLQSVDRTGRDTYKFDATSAIGLLMDGLHYGGIYTGQTVEEVLPGIMGSVPYYIKSNLKGIKLYGWLPVAAPRDNLSQVLFAIGAAVKTDLDGYLRIESLWDCVSSVTGKGRIYLGGSVNYTAPVTSVVVTEHQYIASQETVQLYEGTVANGDIVTFNEPMHDLSASGFAILDSGANWARLSAGAGMLKGKKYLHNTRQITKDVAASQTPNIIKVESATLISLVNSRATAERLANYYKWVETVNTDVIYTGERPGDRTSIYHPYDGTMTDACLQSADITLSGVLKARIKALVGYVPPETEAVVTYDYQDVVTGTTQWPVPEGVTSIRAVLIGGGSGGQAGFDGAAGEASKDVTAGSNGGVAYSSGGAAGAGGDPGTPGAGGRVLIIDLDIPADVKTLSVACGLGGHKGEKNGAAGAEGTDTTLQVGANTYTTAGGQNNGGGYVDIETGVTYGADGSIGTPGGRGGDGATWSEARKPHEGEAIGEDGEGAGVFADGGRGGAPQLIYYGQVIYDDGRRDNAAAQIRSGGGGGGSAKGAPGGNAADAGGRGADAAPAADGQAYGCGGSGGHGGGGAGGAGGVLAATNEQYANTYHVNGSPGGIAGLGSPGGDGAPGCVIIYYGVAHVTTGGWLMTKDDLPFADRTGRRFVV